VDVDAKGAATGRRPSAPRPGRTCCCTSGVRTAGTGSTSTRPSRPSAMARICRIARLDGAAELARNVAVGGWILSWRRAAPVARWLIISPRAHGILLGTASSVR